MFSGIDLALGVGDSFLAPPMLLLRVVAVVDRSEMGNLDSRRGFTNLVGGAGALLVIRGLVWGAQGKTKSRF